MEVGAKLAEIAKKHAKAMAVELIEEVAVQALEEAVKKSATPMDDVVVAALKEPLKKALLDAVNKI